MYIFSTNEIALKQQMEDHLKQHTSLRSVIHPQELALADLFDRLASLGSKVRGQKIAKEYHPESNRITQAIREASSSGTAPPS